jgi:apolipoprotein N-acyltransferase
MQPVKGKWSALVLTALFLAVAIILFVLIYLAFPANQHFTALITIGILSLVFAVLCYLAESLSRDPVSQRSLAWGFFGMGFTVLLLSIGLGPYYNVLSPVAQLYGLLFTILALIVALALIGWRIRAVRATENLEVARGSWRNEPTPSAFSYAAAQSPSVPGTAQPPSTPGSSNPPPPGRT